MEMEGVLGPDMQRGGKYENSDNGKTSHQAPQLLHWLVQPLLRRRPLIRPRAFVGCKRLLGRLLADRGTDSALIVT